MFAAMNRHEDESSDPSAFAQRRETLQERSERIIGKSLIPDTSSADSPDPKGRKDSSSGARRQQVLQAQRNHRLRTQQYIRELEKEVFRLRDVEKDLVGRNSELSSEVENLRFSSQGFAPSSSGQAFPISGYSNTGQPMPSFGFQNISATVHVDLTALQNVVPIGSCVVHPASLPPPEYSTPPYAPLSKSESSQVILADMSTQTALDFVLHLEKPCLPHVKHAHIESAKEPPRTDIEFHSGPSHLLTVSAGIIREQQSVSSDAEIEGAPFQMSESSIDRLFRLSLTLPLTGEVTPVQIWNTLKTLSTRYAVTDQRLFRVKEEFVKYVRCNSFGAVVETEIANRIFAHEFSLLGPVIIASEQ